MSRLQAQPLICDVRSLIRIDPGCAIRAFGEFDGY